MVLDGELFDDLLLVGLAQQVLHEAAHGGAITSVSFHPSGNFLLTASADSARRSDASTFACTAASSSS